MEGNDHANLENAFLTNFPRSSHLFSSNYNAIESKTNSGQEQRTRTHTRDYSIFWNAPIAHLPLANHVTTENYYPQSDLFSLKLFALKAWFRWLFFFLLFFFLWNNYTAVRHRFLYLSVVFPRSFRADVFLNWPSCCSFEVISD